MWTYRTGTGTATVDEPTFEQWVAAGQLPADTHVSHPTQTGGSFVILSSIRRPAPPQYVAIGYSSTWTCPTCGLPQAKKISSKVTVVGWIVFCAVLVIFFPLCWVGLLIREPVLRCQRCRNTIPPN